MTTFAHDGLSLALEVRRPGRPIESIVIAHERVLVGGGAHCDIRLDDPSVAYEQLEIELQGSEIAIRARASVPWPTVDGGPFVPGPIARGATLEIAGTEIRVDVVSDPSRRVPNRARRMAVTFGSVLVALGVPIGVYIAFLPQGDGPLLPSPPPVMLFGGTPSCPAKAKDQARALGESQIAIGIAERERYPFAIEDGIPAVVAFETAAACETATGQREQAGEAQLAARSLRDVVLLDYATHRVRLEHAIETDDIHAARVEVRILRRLTNKKHGQYVDWLAIVERRLELAQRASETKKESALW